MGPCRQLPHTIAPGQAAAPESRFMCLMTFAYQTHPDYNLILIANRDEAYGRPTRGVAPW
ncbi:NRDE family protein, partial [Microbulbifer okhotskensis]|uniref:NRDE family protein n=1 Tax=Microbulbifer okhotskensis TaxID=2926617 RepID=UPI002811F65E